MEIKWIGFWILLGWAAVYMTILFMLRLARRSWTDLFAIFMPLLIVAALLNVLVHPLLGSVLLTALPFLLIVWAGGGR